MSQQYTNVKILLLIYAFGGLVRRKCFYYLPKGHLQKKFNFNIEFLLIYFLLTSPLTWTEGISSNAESALVNSGGQRLTFFSFATH